MISLFSIDNACVVCRKTCNIFGEYVVYCKEISFYH